jgi:hypothetical protein
MVFYSDEVSESGISLHFIHSPNFSEHRVVVLCNTNSQNVVFQYLNLFPCHANIMELHGAGITSHLHSGRMDTGRRMFAHVFISHPKKCDVTLNLLFTAKLGEYRKMFHAQLAWILSPQVYIQ